MRSFIYVATYSHTAVLKINSYRVYLQNFISYSYSYI